MRKKINRFLLTLLLLFSSLAILAQGKVTTPLHEILNALEKEHQVRFNYAEDVIKDVSIKKPDTSLSLEEALKYLAVETGLTFTSLDANIILINRPEGTFICGYVKDFERLEPLSAATVQTDGYSTTTNNEGYFQIAIKNPTVEISIRYLGYKTAILPYNLIENKECSDIFLKPNFESLKEIVVSNYLVNGISKINNGSYEINFSNFDILPGLIDSDVLNAVQAFPGIQSTNETVSNINIRGGTHDQNLILWDEIKMYQSGHFFGLISMYNPQITHKVSLRKNGSDVAYTDGVSGTIKMQTTDYLNTKINGTIGVNLTNANGFVDVPIGNKSSLQVAARKSISDFIKTPTYKSFFDRISQNTEVQNNTSNIANSDKSFDFYDTSLRWLYKISEKDELRLNFINVYNLLVFNENANVNGEDQSRESKLTQNSIAEGLHYKRIWNSDFQTTFEIYETDYKLRSVNANILESQRFLQENIVSETSVKLKTDYKWNDRFHLLSGYHFVETEVTNLDDVDFPQYRLLVSEVVRTHGVFSEIGYRSLNRNTNVNFGLRYNYIGKFKKQIIEPRLSFNQRFLNDFTLEVLGEFKHQNTSQVINFQNDFLGIEKRRWQLSNNEDIPIIRSKQISLGINYKKDGWLFNVEGYYKDVKGITSQSQGFINQYEFSKSNGNYRVNGVDVLFRKAFNNFNSWVSYAYMDNTYLFKAYQEKSFPSNFNVSHTITFGSAYNFKNLKIAAGLNWHTGKPTTDLVEGNEVMNGYLNYADTNMANLKDYMRLDVSALYDFKLGRGVDADIGVSVWNVLDRKNQINEFYQLNDGVVNETIQNSLGITPNAVLRLHFQ